MTDLNKMREWIKTFPGEIPDNFQIDFTNEIPQNAGLFPTGTMEISRRSDIVGNVTVTNQYNFGLYAVFDKPDDHDSISTENAQWVMDFQGWVQEQSILGLAPTFGDLPGEVIRAQNGMFYGEKAPEGIGIYMISITAQFKKYYRRQSNGR